MAARKLQKKKAIPLQWPEKSRCSGYGVFPGGRACLGCDDCEGKAVSRKQLIQRLNQNHSTITLTKRRA